ncbi:MAG: hypothetical protein LBC67_01785 [Spirochaetales bacterium]|jgi:hypothetical protein|nr:hypothetical protein [Spirochaetales bacterium]
MYEKAGAKVVFVEGGGRGILKDFFSTREAALAEKLLVCFFISEEKIIGLLVIAQSPYLFLEESLAGLFFTVVSALTSPLLARSRKAPRRKRASGYVRKDSFLTAVKKYAEELPPAERVKLLGLNASSLVEKIREFNPDVDEFRALQDITALLSTLLDNAPVFVSAKKKKMIMAIAEGRLDPALLVHQVSLVLRRLFQELENIPELEVNEESLTQDIQEGEDGSAFDRLLA